MWNIYYIHNPLFFPTGVCLKGQKTKKILLAVFFPPVWLKGGLDCMSSPNHFFWLLSPPILLARQVRCAAQVPVIPSSPPVFNLCHIPGAQTDGVVFSALELWQIQLRLISLTWEKFLALILTSFSTSCCRWKVSSCSLFSASSLLLLSSSSI